MRKIRKNTLQEKTDNEKHTFDTIISLINFADTKISTIFTIESVIFTAFGTYTLLSFKKYNWCNVCSITKYAYWAVTTISILTFVLSLIVFLSALCPRFNGKHKKVEKNKNLIFFEDIILINKEDFINTAKKTTDQNYKDFLLEEIYSNAKICSKKMHKFRLGLILSGISLLFDIFSIVLTLFI